MHEPWHLLLPLVASLASSFALYTVATLGILWKSVSPRPPFWKGYRMFLGVFWMTAPMAWLYAIPYERLGTAEGSIDANLNTLCFVAFWRVLIMVRVLQVLMNYKLIAAMFLVLAYADAIALVAISFLPANLIGIMGGIGLEPGERILSKLACNVRYFGTLCMPIWLVGALLGLALGHPEWTVSEFSEKAASKPLRALAWGSVLVWIFVLPFTQPEQMLRRRVEMTLQYGSIADGLRIMSDHSPSDFPPHWNPPPRASRFWLRPRMDEVMEEIIENPPAPWVDEIFRRKLKYWLYYPHFANRFGNEQTRFKQVTFILNRLPDGKETLESWIEDKHLYRHHRNQLEVILPFVAMSTEELEERRKELDVALSKY